MTNIIINVEATLQWIAKRGDRTDRLIAVCDPLGLAVEAESEEELQSLMQESLHLLFTDLIADNEFDQFLSEKGWSSNRTPDLTDEEVHFQVPMELVMLAGRNGFEQRTH